MAGKKTAIVTGGSQGIGAGLVTAFLERGYRVVANSRIISKSNSFHGSEDLALLFPGCGEEGVDKLPIYTAGEFDYVRVEVYESCHTYIKSIDMTKSGLALPIVDELATIPLNVWAEQYGYTKLQLNLLSM